MYYIHKFFDCYIIIDKLIYKLKITLIFFIYDENNINL